MQKLDPPQNATLQAKLTASGAKRHSRMSDLSRYMLDHYDELHAMVTVHGYGWADITRVLASEGWLDRNGKPVSVAVTKLTWSRINRRNRAAVTLVSTIPPAPTVNEQHISPLKSQERDDEGDKLPLTFAPIRLARPRDLGPPADKKQTNSTPSLLTEDELNRRLADLAERQGSKKISMPDPL